MKNLRMLTKFFLLFILFLAIPLIIAGFVFNSYMLKYSEDEISKSSITNLKTIKNMNDFLIESITRDTLSLEGPLNDINKDIKYTDLKNNVNDIFILDAVLKALNATIYSNNKLHSIYVYFDDADYVITSNRGSIPKKSFADTGWIKQYEENKKKTIGTFWINSRVVKRGQEEMDESYPGENGDNVLSFILPLNTLMMNIKGAIVANLYEREIFKVMNNTNIGNNGYTYIMDNKGIVVSYGDKQMLGKDITARPFIKNIIHSMSPTGYYIEDTKDKRQLLTYFKSQFNNWTYVGVLPMDSLINKTNGLRNRIFLLILGMLICGIVLSYIIAKRMYNPVKKLMSDIQNRKGIDFKDSGNEMNIISKVFDSLAKQEDTFFDTLEKNKKELWDKYLFDLLRGNSDNNIQDKTLEAKFVFKYFICALLIIDKYDSFKEKFPGNQQCYIKLMILRACEEVTNPNFKIYGVLYEKNKIAVIVNIEDDDPKSNYDALYKSFTALQKEVAKVLDNPISAGIGKTYEDFSGISISFNEAQEALKNRIIKGSGSIIFYEDISEEESKYFYPYHIEKHILNFIKLGQKQETVESIQDLMTEIRNRKGISSDNIIQVFIQLIGNTVKFLVEINVNISDIFGGDYNIYQKLASKETLDEIHTWLIGFYSGIVQYMSKQGTDHKSQVEKILDYIHMNYRLNIDTTSIADNTGLSYSSVGRIVKNKTGKNVLEYINGLRIEEAKRLLRQTDMNIMDISKNIGYNNDQSFTRFFKKYEGVTPGEFRNIS